MNKKIQETKKSHKVPQFLLERFSSRTKSKKYYIWCFDKHKESSFELPISDACAENKFYEPVLNKDMVKRLFDKDILHEDEKVAFKGLEGTFSYLEGKIAPIINKVIKDESISNLSEKEKAELAVFVAYQYIRTDSYRSDLVKIVNSSKDLLSKISLENGLDLSETDYDKMDFHTSLEEGKKLLHAKSLLKSHQLISIISHCIMNKKWVLFRTVNKNPFYIGDSPVTLHNNNDFGPYGNIGFGVPGIQIYLPISKTLTVGFFCNSVFGEEERKLQQNLEKINQQIQNQHSLSILGSNPSIVNSAIKNLEKLKSLKEQVEPAIERRVINLDSENVKFLNHLQVVFSSRFLFSSQNEFSLAKEMIASNPKYKNGFGIKIG